MPLSPAIHVALEAIESGSLPRDLETDDLEFKTQGRSLPDTLRNLAEAAACFANAGGGDLVVGVADDQSGTAAFLGCDLDPRLTQRRIFELTDPRLTVSVDRVVRAGRELLAVTVPSSPDVHAVHGRSTERVGSTCQPMSNSRIATLVSERRGDDWTAQDSSLGLATLDPVAVGVARSMLERSSDPQRRSYARESDADLVRVLGLVTERGTLVNGGALLFTGRMSTGEQMSYVHRRTPAGELLANEHLGTPLLPSVQRLFDLIGARLDRTPVNVPGGQQLQLADLPEAAVREAVVNAVMHRDYRRLGNVQVEHTATRLVVTSPGPFVSGVTIHNVLTTSSRSRNPLLSGAVRTLGLAETAGTGVDRMYAEMARAGLQPPTFDADLDHVRVSLLGGAPNAHLARFVATLPREESEDADTMLALLTLLTARTLTAEKLAPVLQKPQIEVLTVLDRLASDNVGILERTRESARRSRPVYRLREQVVAALGPALLYRRRTVDESDRKVIGLVRETGGVNARMVRLMLDLDATPASRVLGDLVERGILVKTSPAQRGPSVTYGPGPSFPKAPRSRRKAGPPVEKGNH